MVTNPKLSARTPITRWSPTGGIMNIAGTEKDKNAPTMDSTKRPVFYNAVKVKHKHPTACAATVFPKRTQEPRGS
jgi:hypothetical protein